MQDQSRKPIGQGLKCLAELYMWECKNLPILHSNSGRALYNSLIQHFLFESIKQDLPLKSFQAFQSDRVMRLRIQEFEKLGLVTVHVSHEDGRSKTLSPTQKFFDIVDRHTLAMRAIFLERFHIIKKDENPSQN
jgi:hypothetical protein